MREQELEIPYFGRIYVLSMDCKPCGYKKSDVEPAEKHDPARYTLEVSSEDDLSIKIIKSGESTLKIPRVITISPGPASNGYITNVEGIIERCKKAIETSFDGDDQSERKKAKNLIKKLNNVIFGKEKIKIIIEDPSGNSCIVSEKAQKTKI